MDEYCYWEIKTNLDFYFGEFLALCSLFFTIYICYRTYKLFKIHSNVDFKVKIIYINLTLWGISHILKLAVGLVVYAFVFINDDEKVKEEGEKFYQLFCILDSIPTIILQGILLLIPYIWILNIVTFLHISVGKILRKTKCYLAFLKIFLWIRFPIYIALYIFYTVYPYQHHWCDYINYLVLGQACICALTLILSLRILLKNFQLLSLNDDRDRKLLNRQVSLLTLCCFIRLVLDIVFLILANKLSWMKQDIKCVNPSQPLTRYLNTFLYLMTGVILTHYFPVILVLRIYNIKTETSPMKKSSLTFSLID